MKEKRDRKSRKDYRVIGRGRLNEPAPQNGHPTVKSDVELAKERSHNTSWLKLDFVYLEFLSPRAAILYAYLDYKIGYWQSKTENRRKHNGWYYFTIEHLERKLGFPRTTQDRMLKELKDIGLVATRIQGKCGMRYIRLRLTRLIELVRKYDKGLESCEEYTEPQPDFLENPEDPRD